MRQLLDRLKPPAVALIAAVMIGLGVGCATNPYTERHQLIMLPQSYEADLGTQSYHQILHDPKTHISHDPTEVDPVKRVAHRIIEAAKHSKYAETAKQFAWEVTVIKDDKTVNAFALPGGKIAVYTGIFPVAKTEAGLAAVLGHEVTHALARHGAERMSQGLMANLALNAAAIGLQFGGFGGPSSSAIMQALGVGTEVGVLLPFSREHESEADHVGIILAALAGYPPEEAIHLWERMERAGGAQPPEFLSTHPSHGTRIKQLEAWMPEALAEYHRVPHVPVGPDLPSLHRPSG